MDRHRTSRMLALAMILGMAASAAPAQAGSTGNGSAGSGVAQLQNGAGLQQFRFEADAQKHCPNDVVVWGSSQSPGVFFTKDQGPPRVGGFYACLTEAEKAGYQIMREG